MNPRSTLLPCSLLIVCCARAPEDQGQATTAAEAAEEAVLQPSAPPVAAKVAALPEVRYYLIADT